jgi:hypothetical protein
MIVVSSPALSAASCEDNVAVFLFIKLPALLSPRLQHQKIPEHNPWPAFYAIDVSPWIGCVGSLRPQALPKGHRKPLAARPTAQNGLPATQPLKMD